MPQLKYFAFAFVKGREAVERRVNGNQFVGPLIGDHRDVVQNN
jgi:hypothetical protein